MSATVTLLCCLESVDPAALEARLAAAAESLPAGCEHEVLLVGYGAPELLAPPLRALQQRHPGWRVLLHSHRSSPREAMEAARQQLRTPWFVRPGVDAGTTRADWHPSRPAVATGDPALSA
jgi:hypothetical protein